MDGDRSVEGYYSVDYTGSVGQGFGVMVLDTNIVVGADYAGGI